MNLEYVWWILALILAGGGVVAFLAFGRVPEIEDEDETGDEPEAAEAAPGAAVSEAAEATPGAADPDVATPGPTG